MAIHCESLCFHPLVRCSCLLRGRIFSVRYSDAVVVKLLPVVRCTICCSWCGMQACCTSGLGSIKSIRTNPKYHVARLFHSVRCDTLEPTCARLSFGQKMGVSDALRRWGVTAPPLSWPKLNLTANLSSLAFSTVTPQGGVHPKNV